MLLLLLCVVGTVGRGASTQESSGSEAPTEAVEAARKSIEAAQLALAVQFSEAVLAGWERSNPPPRPGDRVGPGKGYSGPPLMPGAIGTVIGPAADKADCWEILWDSDELKENSEHRQPHTLCYKNGTYELAVIGTLNELPGISVVERVPKVEWTDSAAAPFAEFAAASDTPLLFRGTAVNRWKAMQEWADIDTLLQNVTLLPGVKVNNGKNFRYYHRAPMNNEEQIVKEYRATTFTKHNMTPSDFLQRVRNPVCDEDSLSSTERPNDDDPAPAHTASLQYSWAGKVEDWGLLRLSEVLPLDPFMVIGPRFDPEKEHLFRETRVWLSPKGTITPAHYDISHNMFIQIRGRKRVVLFPPVSWQSLYPWPILHPGGLSAQATLGGDCDEQHSKFPAFICNQLPAYVVDVNPGDVLYIPPLWFHQVESLEDLGVSVSVWSPYIGSELYQEAVETTPLPIKESWSSAQKIAALRVLIESLVRSLDIDGIDAAEFVRWTLVDTRYLHISAPDDAELKENYCWNREIEDDLLLNSEEFFTTGLQKVVSKFTDILQQAGSDRRDIYLANFIELAVNTIVGSKNTPTFLRAIVSC